MEETTMWTSANAWARAVNQLSPSGSLKELSGQHPLFRWMMQVS